MKKAEPVNDLSTMTPQPAAATDAAQACEAAEALAIKALIFLATDRDRMHRFITMSGLRLDRLRAAAETPHFLAGVLDYLASDESLLLTFAANCDIDPATVAQARAALACGPSA